MVKALIQTLETIRTQMNMDYDQWSQGDRSDSRTAARLGGYADRLSTALGLADAADAEIARLTAERDAVGINGEMGQAQLRGWRDFFSGQPRDMPYHEPGTYAKNSQLNFAWCIGYDQASESELYNLMVGRADRSAEKSQALANALSVAEAERDEAYGYLSRLFRGCAPQCEVLPDILGVATQLDNYMAGVRAERDALSAQIAALVQEWRGAYGLQVSDCIDELARLAESARLRSQKEPNATR